MIGLAGVDDEWDLLPLLALVDGAGGCLTVVLEWKSVGGRHCVV